MVDQSLLRRAADRGVTICFADLDGADGLWVPEERTVLVNRGLPEAKVAEVIEHELAHVMIDDQHADLDAGKEVLVGQPSGRRRETVALAAALGLVAVVGGVMYGIHTARGPEKQDQVAPNPNPGLIASESGPSPSLSPSRGPHGIVYVTVYPTAATASGLGPAIMPSPMSPTATKPAPTQTSVVPTSRPPAPPPPTISPSAPPSPTSDPPPETSPPAPTTVPPPTTPDPSAGNVGDTGGTGDAGGIDDTGGVGDTGDAPLGSDPATAGDASVVVPAGSATGP